MQRANAYTRSYTCEDARVCNAYVGCMSVVHALREHIDIRPRRFSRRSEQNFNDPRYQSRDERVSTDRPIDPDQHHAIPCSLTLYGTEAHYM